MSDVGEQSLNICTCGHVECLHDLDERVRNRRVCLLKEQYNIKEDYREVFWSWAEQISHEQICDIIRTITSTTRHHTKESNVKEITPFLLIITLHRQNPEIFNSSTQSLQEISTLTHKIREFSTKGTWFSYLLSAIFRQNKMNKTINRDY